MWPVKDIPDKDKLYLRIHKNHYPKGEMNVKMVFKEQGRSLSTDWERHSTPEQTRNRGGQDASNYGVISLITGDVRGIDDLKVEHSPIEFPPEGQEPNRAHTDVLGINRRVEIKVKLQRLANFEIPVPE